jgi:hypothetical protein
MKNRILIPLLTITTGGVANPVEAKSKSTPDFLTGDFPISIHNGDKLNLINNSIDHALRRPRVSSDPHLAATCKMLALQPSLEIT